MEEEELLVVIRNYGCAVDPEAVKDMCARLREMTDTRVISLNIVGRRGTEGNRREGMLGR